MWFVGNVSRRCGSDRREALSAAVGRKALLEGEHVLRVVFRLDRAQPFDVVPPIRRFPWRCWSTGPRPRPSRYWRRSLQSASHKSRPTTHGGPMSTRASRNHQPFRHTGIRDIDVGATRIRLQGFSEFGAPCQALVRQRIAGGRYPAADTPPRAGLSVEQRIAMREGRTAGRLTCSHCATEGVGEVVAIRRRGLSHERCDEVDGLRRIRCIDELRQEFPVRGFIDVAGARAAFAGLRGLATSTTLSGRISNWLVSRSSACGALRCRHDMDGVLHGMDAVRQRCDDPEIAVACAT